jgi:hypothetical protein
VHTVGKSSSVQMSNKDNSSVVSSWYLRGQVPRTRILEATQYFDDV